MKKLTKIVALIIAVIIMIPAVATAQNTNMPTSLPFLSSRAALRAYARESARQAYLTLESEGMEGTWSTGTQWDGPASAETILKYVDSFRFTFNMRNPKDYVRGVAEIKNGDWDNLFSAESWGLPAAAGEEFVLPELYFWFQLEKLIPFKVDRSVQHGELMYLNDDGKTVTTIPIQVKNGKVYFPSDFAGKGILILRDKNWDQYLYNLRNGGVRIPLSRVQYSGSQSWIEDLLVFNDPTYIDHQVWSWDGHGNNPTFEINVTVEKGIMVKTRAWTREGAEAIGFYVRPEGASEWKYYPRPVPERFTPISLPGARIWFVIPAWNPDEFKEWDPAVGEKGEPVPGGKG